MLRDCTTRYGRFFVDDNDKYLAQSLIHLGEFAEAQVSLFRQIIKPGMVVCDVGANVGAHSVVFASLGAFVHAFEPQRFIFNLLCANVAVNRLSDKVFCHRKAVGKDRGHVGIAVMDTSQSNNLGAFNIDTDGAILDTVEMVRLTQPCHFLKIDVEGYEADVLRGAADMISACTPMIYVENDRPEKSDELIAVIRELGYVPYWHVTPLDNPENFNKSAYRIGCDSIDMLCMPRGVTVVGLDEAFPNERIFHDTEARQDERAA